jgi:hypothetical protein
VGNFGSHRFCCRAIDDQVVSRRELHRQIARLFTFENAIHLGGCTPKQIGRVVTERQKPSLLGEGAIAVAPLQAILRGQLNDNLAVRDHQGMRRR